MSFGSFQDQNGGAPTPQPMAEINTTPLVDVMLVLLVIFIITAPLFQQAVPVDLPQVESTKLDDRPLVLQLAIDGEGQLYLEGQKIAMDALATSAKAAVERSRASGKVDPELHLRADRNTRYERVAEVMAIAQGAGVTKIAFVTEAPAPRR